MDVTAEKLEVHSGKSAPFPNHHRWDRAYHLLWLASAWGAIIAGFGPPFFHRIVTGEEEHETLVLSIHASVFTAWLFLLSLQIGLVNWKKVTLHMKLGLLSVPLGIAVVCAGVAVAASASRREFDKSQDLQSLQFFFHQLMDMAVFGAFFAAAIIMRKSAAMHKRLIVLSSTFLLGAGFSRAIGPLVGKWFEDPSAVVQFAGYVVIAYGGINLLMAMAVIYDLITRKRVHPVNAWGVPIILGCEVLTICMVQHVHAWGRVAHWLLYWN